MAFTHSLTISWTGSSGAPVQATIENEAAQEVNISDSLGVVTDQLVACTIDVSQMKSLFMYASTATTVKTNNSGAPDDTITLAAGEPLVWADGGSCTNPLGTDVTALYITCAAASDIEFRFLVDPTV